MAVLYTDSRQQAGKHDIKNEWWALHGVSTIVRKLDFGDYMTDGSNISVDTKRNIDEIAKNINGREHDRFKRECIRARDAGYLLIILVENTEGVLAVDELRDWINGHCRACVHFRTSQCDPRDSGEKCRKHGTRKPIQGERLARAMSTMSERYGVRFEFCPPSDAARRICCTLGISYNNLCCDCYRFDNGKCLPAIGMEVIQGPAVKCDGNDVMCDWGCPF